MYLTSQGDIPLRRLGIPPGGNYNNDTDTLKRNRADLIVDIRREGGQSPPYEGGSFANEMTRGYRAMEPLFRQFDRTRPRATYLDGSPGTWDQAKEAVAEILGDGKLQEEGKAEQRKGQDEENKEPRDLSPLGNLNRLT